MRTSIAAAGVFLVLDGPVLVQSVIPYLPNEMIGIWGFEADACDDEDSYGRLTVEAKRVAWFESSARSSGSRMGLSGRRQRSLRKAKNVGAAGASN
jgi:hypothetical protein